MTDRVKGSILALGGAACWGISGCMGQYLFTTEGMSATWMTPIRLFLAGLILCADYAIKDHRLLFAPWKNGRDRLDLLIYGIAGVSCCQFLYFLTIDLSTAGIATILQDVSPAMILVVACWMPLFAFATATYFTLRSGGKTFITFLFDSCFTWVVTVPAAFLLTRYTTLPVVTAYLIASALDFIKCTIGFVLVKRGGWVRNIVG